MKVFVVFAAILAVALAQNYPGDESPKPYSFSYVAEGEEGTSSHSEDADGTGTVRGSYSLTDIDGRNRVVEYIAGPEGFNAIVRTNEPGTENAAPADVVIESTADITKPILMNTPRAERPVAPRPAAPRPAAAAAAGAGGAAAGGAGGNTRFVLVPSDDPRARSYYGDQS